MENNTRLIFDELFERYPQLKVCEQDIISAFEIIKKCYTNGGKVLVCGNGGSAADCEHIVGELMKGFILKRKITDNQVMKIKDACPKDWEYLSDNLQGALPGISLVSQNAISTAFINDVKPDMVFAQQVFGYGKKGDVVIGLTTSGNSSNILNAIKVSKAFEIRTIGMTGASGGQLSTYCDAIIKAPADETYKVQEYHLPVYHALCAAIECEFFK